MSECCPVDTTLARDVLVTVNLSEHHYDVFTSIYFYFTPNMDWNGSQMSSSYATVFVIMSFDRWKLRAEVIRVDIFLWFCNELPVLQGSEDIIFIWKSILKWNNDFWDLNLVVLKVIYWFNYQIFITDWHINTKILLLNFEMFILPLAIVVIN